MADIVYRGNLKAASFPFISSNQGRTVIVKGQDQNFINGLAPKESLDSSIGVPQIYYCHNVIPTDEGYRSIGYEQAVVSTFPSSVVFTDIVYIRDDAGNHGYVGLTTDGDLLLLENGSSSWRNIVGAPAASLLQGRRMTAAYVSGITYIYFSEYYCYAYIFSAGAMAGVALSGLTATDIIGITSSKGYLIAYSKNAVAWSSTLDATDFVPSLTTGAGGGSIEGARGDIVTIEPVYGGLIVFTTANAVAAVASDNTRYPYNFTEITNAGGLQSPVHVSVGSSSKAVYAYTTSGFQTVSLSGAQVVFPEVTDFLTGGYREDFDETTNTFSSTYVDVAAQFRIALISDRYLIISHNGPAQSRNFALYYDTAFKQWGKLKIDHVLPFEYEVTDTQIPRKSVGFLQSNGTVYRLNPNAISSANGVMLLGKYQYVRSRLLTLQSVDIENVIPGGTFSLHTLPSLDGKNLDSAVAGYDRGETAPLAGYNFFSTAKNHSLLLKGAFNAVSVELTFTVHGAV